MRRVVLTGVIVAGLIAASTPAVAAGTVSQATAQAVNLNLGAGALTVAESPTPTVATNDGTGGNTVVHGNPAVSGLGGETFLTAGALAETAVANTDGSSYGCAGTVGQGGDIQIGQNGQTCTPQSGTTGGVTVDLGTLPGIGTALAPYGDIKITADAIYAHGYLNGAGPAELDGGIANVRVTLGTTVIPITLNATTPNQDLLSAILSSLSAMGGGGAVDASALALALDPLLSLTVNYQPAPDPNANGTYSVTGLHVGLLGGQLLTADIAHVTVGPNVGNAAVDAFSFQDLPLILGGLAILALLGYGLRTGFRRIRPQS